MLEFSSLDPHLLDPVDDPTVFNASLGVYGSIWVRRLV